MVQHFSVDLTGPGSHSVTRELGKGWLSIGPTKSDLTVGEHERINWRALDAPDLSANDWPDRVRYEGADPAFAAWVSSRRGLSSVEFVATSDTRLDFTDADPTYITLEAREHVITVQLPSAAHIRHLILVGQPDHFVIRLHPDGEVPGVILQLPRDPVPDRRVLPADGSQGTRTIALPPALEATSDVAIYSNPLDVPFDARSLSGCSMLRRVEIRGAVAHLESLADADLSALELRYVPDLRGLPPLSSWPSLETVIVWNCDEKATKTTRSEIRRMPEGPGFRSASKGRDLAWFATEYGLPFSGWPKRTASKATRAFAAAAKAIRKAETPEECLEVIDGFVGVANELSGIETAEREDLAEAVQMLADLTVHLDGER